MQSEAQVQAVGSRPAFTKPGWQRAASTTVRFVRAKPMGGLGALVVLVMAFAALFAPIISPHDPLAVDVLSSLSAPNGKYWLGTDELGRDIFSRLIYGSQASLYVGFMVITFGTLVGTLVGLVSGYEGGRFDLITQRIIDMMQAFPALILAMALVAMLGASINNVIIAVSIVIIPGAARIVRGSALSVRQQQFVEAARALGASDLRILTYHIFPNVLAPVIVLMSIQLGTVILVEASLSFLGLGTPPPTPTWGGMLSGTGRQYFEIAPWLAIFPGIAISLAVLGFNMLGDALRDVLDPRLRGA